MSYIRSVKAGFKRVWNSAGMFAAWEHCIGPSGRIRAGSSKFIDLALVPFKPSGTSLEKERTKFLAEHNVRIVFPFNPKPYEKLKAQGQRGKEVTELINTIIRNTIEEAGKSFGFALNSILTPQQVIDLFNRIGNLANFIYEENPHCSVGWEYEKIDNLFCVKAVLSSLPSALEKVGKIFSVHQDYALIMEIIEAQIISSSWLGSGDINSVVEDVSHTPLEKVKEQLGQWQTFDLCVQIIKKSKEFGGSALKVLPSTLEAGLSPQQIILLFERIAAQLPDDTHSDYGIYVTASVIFDSLPAVLAKTKDILTPDQAFDFLMKILAPQDHYDPHHHPHHVMVAFGTLPKASSCQILHLFSKKDSPGFFQEMRKLQIT